MVFDFQTLKENVIKTLSLQTDPNLTYHNVNHTIDVLNSCERIAKEEGVNGVKELLLLKIAALYHDTGFLFIYKGHEEKSCELVKDDLSNFNFSNEDMEIIYGIIRATKIPQSPKTHLEKIICDADLDYLGRDDFDVLSNELKEEYLKVGIVKTEEEWMQLQIQFIGAHKYFTRSSFLNQTPGKLKHLKKLQQQDSFNITN